jgi:hypothetical protein
MLVGRKSLQQVYGRQYCMGKHRRVGRRRDHAFWIECGGAVLHQGYMITQLHPVAPGGLDTAVGDQPDQDDLLDAMLLELGVEIGVGKARFRLFCLQFPNQRQTPIWIKALPPDISLIGRNAC